MAVKIIKTTFKLRRGLASEWAAKNPILSDGEPGFEIDTFRLKVGNGVLPYNELPYIEGSSADIEDLIGEPIPEELIATLFEDEEAEENG